MRRRKLSKKDFELRNDPIWVSDVLTLRPKKFFLTWWQRVAEKKWNDARRWFDAAVELGYIAEVLDPHTGETTFDLINFEFDRDKYRDSLKIPRDLPVVKCNAVNNNDIYQRLWDQLLTERGEE